MAADGDTKGARRNRAVRKKETRERGRRKGGRERDERGTRESEGEGDERKGGSLFEAPGGGEDLKLGAAVDLVGDRTLVGGGGDRKSVV